MPRSHDDRWDRSLLELYPDMQDKVVGKVRELLVLRISAWACKIHEQTLYGWMRKGQAAIAEGDYENQYARLHFAVRAAQADAALEMLTNIKNRQDNWQANAWILERCLRDDFGVDANKMAELTAQISALQEFMSKFKKQEDIYKEPNDEGQEVDSESH